MDRIFALANVAALATWLVLLTSLAWARLRPAAQRLAGRFVPAAFALLYGVLLASHWGAAEGGGFGSAAEVAALFAVPGLLVAGWTHYLAFDLFVGAWIAGEGLRRGLSPWLLAPCLVVTFLAGPLGFLLYLGLAAIAGRRAA